MPPHIIKEKIMEAYLKYNGSQNDNYNRFGAVIPKVQTRIDVQKYFNCDEAREKFIISKLLTDTKIDFNVIKPASTKRDEIEEISSKRGRPRVEK